MTSPVGHHRDSFGSTRSACIRSERPPQKPLQNQPRVYLEMRRVRPSSSHGGCLSLLDQAANPNMPALYPSFVTLDWLFNLQAALSDLHHSCNSLAKPDNLAEYFALTCDVLPRRVSSP
jgi:hypothetical protein